MCMCMCMGMESPHAQDRSPPAQGGDALENISGLLKIKVKRGLELAVRDITDSDPYVVIKMGQQKVKTRVMHNNVNPVWDQELLMAVVDANVTMKLRVYDHDTFSKDDSMGDAEFEIKSFLEAIKMPRLDRHPNGTVLKRIQPSRANCLAEESCIKWIDKEVVQELFFRLRHVETGEVEIELRWEDLKGSK